MPQYQIYRMKDGTREQFRWQPHTAGTTVLKPKDFEKETVVEATSEYAAWQRSREADAPLRIGDLLEIDGGPLRICKYIGFEDAVWFVPETAKTPGAGAAS